MPRRRLGQQIEIQRLAGVLKERPLALGEVMGNARQDYAGKTRHWAKLAYQAWQVNLGLTDVSP